MKKSYQPLIWLAWVALPLTAFRYWSAWDRLPARMATHFNAAGQPNGWMTREVSFQFGLGITAFVLAVFTGALLMIQKRRSWDAVAWAFLGLFYLVTGAVYYGNVSVLSYNLNGGPVQLGWTALVAVGVLILSAVYLGAQRGKPLATEQWIATETHASPLLGAMLLVPLLIELWALSVVPGSVRLTLLIMFLLLLAIAAFAWSGFQYNFGPAGVEIRTLGYRLRSIPASEIGSYAIESWNILRGYGIRGVGRSRAYTWGNKVVHIRTTRGDVFLGHSDPERIVRDLNAIKQFAH